MNFLKRICVKTVLSTNPQDRPALRDRNGESTVGESKAKRVWVIPSFENVAVVMDTLTSEKAMSAILMFRIFGNRLSGKTTTLLNAGGCNIRR